MLNMPLSLLFLTGLINFIESKHVAVKTNSISINETIKRNQSEAGQLELRYEAFEELPPETVVGDLAADLKKLKLNYRSVINYNYNNFQRNNFLILSQKVSGRHLSSSSVTLFGVNSTSGIMKVVKQIDREELCSGSAISHESCLVHLDVLNSVESGGWPCFREILKITVDILDINDHKPTFKHIGRSFQASFSELAPIGSGSALPLAEDKDSTKFGIQTYFIEEMSEAENVTLHFHDTVFGNRELSEKNEVKSRFFRLDIQKLKEHGLILGVVLRIRTQLDRESRDVHWLRLLAVDGGNPAFQAQLLIQVTVEDFNDNSPKFEQSIYEFDVNQISSGEFALGKVQAGDLDVGKNGEVHYFIDSCQIISPIDWQHPLEADLADFGSSDVFFADEATGELFSRKRLQKIEETVVFKLVLRAEDRGEHPLSDRTTVFVRVIPSLLSSSHRDSAPGKTVNNYSFPHHGSLMKIGLPETAAKLVADRFEEIDVKFSRTEFSFKVYENQPEGTLIGVLSLVNKRTGHAAKNEPKEKHNTTKSGNTTFRLKGNKLIHDHFHLDPHSGTLLTYTELDREMREFYHFMVEVLDVRQGTKTLVADSANLSVQILDANDNSPFLTLIEQFSGYYKSFTVPETQFLGYSDQGQRSPNGFSVSFSMDLPAFVSADTALFSVHVSDLDEGQNAEVNVKVHSSNALLRFDIVRQEIEFTNYHDCNHRETISLVAEACDGGLPKLCSFLELLLTCPHESFNSTNDWNLARAKTILGSVNTKWNLLVVGALTAFFTFSTVLACFFIVGYLRNLTRKSSPSRAEKFRPVWSVKREGFARPEVDFLRPPPLWGDNLENCLLHTTDV